RRDRCYVGGRVSAPYELIAAPFSAYVAPMGEPFPSLDVADPTAGTNWTLLGASGHRSITHDGLQVFHDIRYLSAPFTLPGATAPSRVARTSEDLIVTFALADMTAEV